MGAGGLLVLRLSVSVVVVVVAEVTPARSIDRQSPPANWNIRFPLSNNHLYDTIYELQNNAPL